MTSQRADKKKGYRSRRKKDQATWHEHPHAPGHVRSCHSHNRQGLCCLGTTRANNGQRMRNKCKPRVAGAGSTRGGIDAGSGPHAGHANVNSPSSRVRSEEFAFEPSIYQPLPLAADHTAYQFLRSGLNNLEESKPCLKKS